MFTEYKDILTVGEVCVMLKVCPGKVYNYLKTGELSGYRDRRDWRITKSSVIEYVKNHLDTN